MKKKFLAATLLLTVPMIFSGCAKTEPTVLNASESGSSGQTEPQITDDAGQAASAATDSAGQETPQVQDTIIPNEEKKDGSVVHLALQPAETCIDYDIDSYEPVQAFSYKLFQENIGEENPVLSPVSAYLALFMAGVGADGNTREEFDSILGDGMEVFSYDMMNVLPKNSENTKVSLANSAWLDNQFLVKEQWLEEIKSLMDAQAFQSNLSSVETMNSMNQWIEENTNGLIKQMIEEPLDAETRLVLFNTVYFKAKWASLFDANRTMEEDFTLGDGTVTKAQMMQDSLHLDYLANDFVEGVVLPYRNWEEGDGNLAFVALKPKSSDINIREVYGKLDSETITELRNTKENKLVNLKLPRFEVTFDQNLNKSLQSMGLNDAFDEEKADFSQMGTTESGNNLYINLVRQKAKVIVDEEGTEAAAATEVMMMECMALAPEEPVDMFFDEPFLYLIVDMDKELPLFIGILDNPSA